MPDTAPQPATVAFIVYWVVTVGLATVVDPEAIDKFVFGDLVIPVAPVN